MPKGIEIESSRTWSLSDFKWLAFSLHLILQVLTGVCVCVFTSFVSAHELLSYRRSWG